MQDVPQLVENALYLLIS